MHRLKIRQKVGDLRRLLSLHLLSLHLLFSFRHIYIQWHTQVLKHLFRQFWEMYIMTQHFLYPENFFHICSRATSDFILHHRLILPILKLQISEVLQDVLFCVFSFSMLFLRSFMYLDISVAHAFLFLRNIPLYEYTSLFTLFLFVGYLGHI